MTTSLKQIVRLAVACLVASGLSSCGFIQVAHDVSLDEAMKMPPFEATVDNVQISHPWFLYHRVDIWLTRVDSGKHLDLDICPANDFVLGFARSLHEGATYSFPAVFGEYVNSTPTNFTKASANW